MTVEEIIDGILDREGWNGPDFLDRGDRGGRTTWGISERYHPEAWANGPPTRAQAALIYRTQYVAPFAWVEYEPLRVQLIDFGVNSGTRRAVEKLQWTVGVIVDGNAGPRTRAATNLGDSARHRLVNNALVAARLKFIDDIEKLKDQKRFEEGWEDRALFFLVP